MQGDAFPLHDIELMPCRFYIRAAHLLNDQIARELAVIREHLEDENPSREIFFDAMHGHLPGARHRVGSQNVCRRHGGAQ